MKVIETKAPFADLASNFGTGLGQGLQSLANMKLNDIQQQKQLAQKSKFWHGIGLPGLEYQDPQVQKAILDRLEGFSLGGGQQQGGLKIGPNPMERRHQETIDAAKEANAVKAEAKLKSAQKEEEAHTLDKLQPFISKHQEDVKLASRTKKLLLSMRENLIKNKDKFPEALGALAGNLPAWTRTDPDVRKYEADLNKWVLLATNALKGQPTNYKTRLLESSKAGVDKPYATKLAQINEALKETEDVEQTDRDILDIRKAAGKWPRDLELQLASRNTARSDPLNHPEAYEEGTVLEDNGKLYTIVNGEWQEGQ